jgi:hypothetical protein
LEVRVHSDCRSLPGRKTQDKETTQRDCAIVPLGAYQEILESFL